MLSVFCFDFCHHQIYYSNDTNMAEGDYSDSAQSFLPFGFCPKKKVYLLIPSLFLGENPL